MQWLSSSILSSEPITVGKQTLVVRSHAVQLNLPSAPAAFVWNRPIAVQVQAEGEPEQQIPILDRTRMIQVLLLAIGILASMLMWRKIK